MSNPFPAFQHLAGLSQAGLAVDYDRDMAEGTPSARQRLRNLVRMVVAGPMFVLVMLIPALVAAHLFALGWWLRQQQWLLAASVCRWSAIILAVAVVLWLAGFLVAWIVQIARVAMGRDDPSA